ncbi:hypothetical protein GCM10009504_40260 [Pseudomonas laurentiana]|nr:hypothetical protein GCM10009504_40260 [Pseudomonas laurentiana]
MRVDIKNTMRDIYFTQSPNRDRAGPQGQPLFNNQMDAELADA